MVDSLPEKSFDIRFFPLPNIHSKYYHNQLLLHISVGYLVLDDV